MSDVSTRDSLPQSAPAAFRVDLSIADERGTTLPVQVIARDGSPPSDHSGATLPLEETRESQLLPPPGTEAYLVTHAFDTCCAGDRLPGRRLVIITTLATATTPGATARVEPASARNLFGGLLAKHTERRRVIAMTEYPRPGVSD